MTKTVLAVFLAASTLAAQDKPKINEKELYPLGPDSQPQEGVPKGTVTKYHWTSQIFAKTERDYWVYVPAQYDKDKPTALMVFQDGGGFRVFSFHPGHGARAVHVLEPCIFVGSLGAGGCRD